MEHVWSPADATRGNRRPKPGRRRGARRWGRCRGGRRGRVAARCGWLSGHVPTGRRRRARARTTPRVVARSRLRIRSSARSARRANGSAPRNRMAAAPAAPARIRHATLGGVLVDQLPGDRPVQHLPQRLGCLEAVPLRHAEPPRTVCSGESSARRTSPSRLPEQPAELRHRDPFTLMRIQVLLDPLTERQGRGTAGQEPAQPVLKRPLRLSPAPEPADPAASPGNGLRPDTGTPTTAPLPRASPSA